MGAQVIRFGYMDDETAGPRSFWGAEIAADPGNAQKGLLGFYARTEEQGALLIEGSMDKIGEKRNTSQNIYLKLQQADALRLRDFLNDRFPVNGDYPATSGADAAISALDEAATILYRTPMNQFGHYKKGTGIISRITALKEELTDAYREFQAENPQEGK